MATEQITIDVDPETAELYRTASAEQRQRLSILIALQLRSSSPPTRTLTEVMDEMGKQAMERGMTPEILEEILRDE